MEAINYLGKANILLLDHKTNFETTGHDSCFGDVPNDFKFENTAKWYDWQVVVFNAVRCIGKVTSYYGRSITSITISSYGPSIPYYLVFRGSIYQKEKIHPMK